MTSKHRSHIEGAVGSIGFGYRQRAESSGETIPKHGRSGHPKNLSRFRLPSLDAFLSLNRFWDFEMAEVRQVAAGGYLGEGSTRDGYSDCVVAVKDGADVTFG